MPTRRQFLGCVAAGSLYARFGFAASKPMRGIFIILATPYTEDKAIDYEDLAAEVHFMDRCGVQGMVWPQMASEYTRLTREERFHGMEVLAKAAKGKRPALVLGVQGPSIEAALDYARRAEALEPDALIAIPPTEAHSLNDFREYYRTLGSHRETSVLHSNYGRCQKHRPRRESVNRAGARVPNFGYVKEEYAPVVQRMSELAAHRPVIKAVFSGNGGIDLLYEMRLGFDGTMPGAPYADLYAQVWDLYHGGEQQKARDLFSKLLLMINVDAQIPGARQYMMKRRGVFKTTVSRQLDVKLSPEAIQEIDFNFEALRPYLRA